MRLTTACKHYKPVIHVLTGACMISFSGVWVTLAGVHPLISAFYRVFFGFFFLLAAAVCTRDLKPLSPKTLFLIFFCGLAFALDLFCWHTSIGFIGPGLATILGNFQVFFLAGCGILFFGEKLRLRFLLALPLAIVGLFLVAGGNWRQLDETYKTGISYGLLTALCYTAFLLLLRKIQTHGEHFSFFQSLMLVSLTCSIALGFRMLAIGESFAVPGTASLLSLLCLGLFSQTVGWALIANAMPNIRPSLTGLVLLLQPALAFIWDVVFFSRPTGFINWLGAGITLAAIYMGLTGSVRNR